MNLAKFYDGMFAWGAVPLPRILLGIIIFIVGYLLIRLLRRRIKNQMKERQVHSTLQPFFISLSITALHILLLIVVMEIVGIQLTIFTAVIGAGSVTVGLALSGTFQNFAGGVFILLLKPFEIDDNIVAQGTDGVVTSIQLFYTVVLTFDNKTVIIPNGKLFNEIITNVSREGKRRIDFEIKLGYIIDIEQVKTLINQAIKKTANVLNDKQPVIGVSAMEVDGLKIAIKVWTNTGNYLNTSYALQENILKDLKTAGVKLPGL